MILLTLATCELTPVIQAALEHRMVYLVRHAHCNGVVFEGETLMSDPGISDKGTEQAAALTNWLLEQGVNYKSRVGRVLVSPARRALGTAQPLVEALGVAAEVDLDALSRSLSLAPSPHQSVS